YLFPSRHAAPPEIRPLSLHDALPISGRPLLARGNLRAGCVPQAVRRRSGDDWRGEWLTVRPERFALDQRSAPRPACGPSDRERRSEEHTSELQSRFDLVCRLLLEKKK